MQEELERKRRSELEGEFRSPRGQRLSSADLKRMTNLQLLNCDDPRAVDILKEKLITRPSLVGSLTQDLESLKMMTPAEKKKWLEEHEEQKKLKEEAERNSKLQKQVQEKIEKDMKEVMDDYAKFKKLGDSE